MTQAGFADGKLQITSAAAAKYSAAVTDSKIDGQWMQGPLVNPLTLTRQ